MQCRLLLRFDDVTPTMRWEPFASIMAVALDLGIQPLLAVVPDNADDELVFGPERSSFWDDLRDYVGRGAEIGQHGYRHQYGSTAPGLVGPWPRSEFAGFDLETQRRFIRAGYDILVRRALAPVAFVAPSHSFDLTTLAALQLETSIRTISDGLAAWPWREGDFVFVPQVLGRPSRHLPGFQTVVIHPNTIAPGRLDELLELLSTRARDFVSLSDAAELIALPAPLGVRTASRAISRGRSLLALQRSVRSRLAPDPAPLPGEVWRVSGTVPPRIGGKEVHVAALSEAQARSRAVHLFYSSGEPDIPGVTCRRVTLGGAYVRESIQSLVLTSLVALRAALPLRRRPAVLHVHGDVYEAAVLSVLGRVLGRRMPRTVLSVHGMPTSSRWAARLWGWCDDRGPTVIAVSSAVRESLQRMVAPSCTVHQISSAPRSTFSEAAGTRRPADSIVSMGLLASRRHFDLVIEAVALAELDVPIRIFGDGPDRQRLVELAERLGVRAEIGPEHDPAAIAAALSHAVYVHPTSMIGEGFPTSILEALATRSHVLTERFEALDDYLVAGQTCTVFDGPAELARHLPAALARETFEAIEVPTWQGVVDSIDQVLSSSSPDMVTPAAG